MIHQELKNLFAERRSPTHLGSANLKELMRPILQLAALADKQMAVYREHHLNAKVAIHDHALDGKQERLKQTFRSTQSATSAFIESGERFLESFSQLERYLDEDEADVLRWEKNPDPPTDV